MYRRKYSKENVFFENVFIEKVGKEDAFRYIVDRTLLRPRDAIAFVNQCLSHSAGKPEVRRGAVYSAEADYSEGRMEALVDEWRPIFPAIEPVIMMLRRRKASFEVAELYTSHLIEDLLGEVYSRAPYQRDTITHRLDQATMNGIDRAAWEVVVEIIDRLHLIGAIGVSIEPTKPVQWFYKTQKRLSRNSIDVTKKVRIHPMLHSALGVIK